MQEGNVAVVFVNVKGQILEILQKYFTMWLTIESIVSCDKTCQKLGGKCEKMCSQPKSHGEKSCEIKGDDWDDVKF